jgi:hypothetical protein
MEDTDIVEARDISGTQDVEEGNEESPVKKKREYEREMEER